MFDKQKDWAYNEKRIKEYLLLGEVPIQTKATAQKCRETPMGRTETVEMKAFFKVAKRFAFYVV